MKELGLFSLENKVHLKKKKTVYKFKKGCYEDNGNQLICGQVI